MFTRLEIALFHVLLAFVGRVKASEETGHLAGPRQFPFVIRLYSTSNDESVTYCTATIIASDKLLTAGHCCRTEAVRYAVLGDPDQTDFVYGHDRSKYYVYNVKNVILHPNFERSQTKLVHDLCLLILENPMRPSDGHEAIRISYEKLGGKKNCTALGWGTNFGFEVQHKLYYKAAIAYRCNLRFGDSRDDPGHWFVCLEPHSVCPGDSGGPLVCDGRLYGIASFFIGVGRPEESNPKCEEGVVDYYSELFSEGNFIEKNGSLGTSRPKLNVCLSYVLFLFSFLPAIIVRL